jgi:hypothetical protein
MDRNFEPMWSGWNHDNRFSLLQWRSTSRADHWLLRHSASEPRPGVVRAGAGPGHWSDWPTLRSSVRRFLFTAPHAEPLWGRGEAPTFEEYASAWLQTVKEHRRPNAEWVFLSDRARGTAGPDWKRVRAKKAAKVMKMLNKISG